MSDARFELHSAEYSTADGWETQYVLTMVGQAGGMIVPAQAVSNLTVPDEDLQQHEAAVLMLSYQVCALGGDLFTAPEGAVRNPSLVAEFGCDEEQLSRLLYAYWEDNPDEKPTFH